MFLENELLCKDKKNVKNIKTITSKNASPPNPVPDASASGIPATVPRAFPRD